ncbi:MAG: NosD domain-containing protein [Haloferacaceae archaeon]
MQNNGNNPGVSVGGTDNVVNDSTITGNSQGVLLRSTSDSTVRNNTIRNNGDGIGSKFATISSWQLL